MAQLRLAKKKKSFRSLLEAHDVRYVESFIRLLCIIVLVWQLFPGSRLFLFCCNENHLLSFYRFRMKEPFIIVLLPRSSTSFILENKLTFRSGMTHYTYSCVVNSLQLEKIFLIHTWTGFICIRGHHRIHYTTTRLVHVESRTDRCGIPVSVFLQGWEPSSYDPS
jgi:hypothetical protein